MKDQAQDIAQGVAGAATTATGVIITYIEVANQLVDLGAGLVAIAAGIFTCSTKQGVAYVRREVSDNWTTTNEKRMDVNGTQYRRCTLRTLSRRCQV
jgi:hypothetical protein